MMPNARDDSEDSANLAESDSDSYQGPFLPIKIMMEENLTVSRGFDDCSYLLCLSSAQARNAAKPLDQLRKRPAKRPAKNPASAAIKISPFVCSICEMEQIGVMIRSLTGLARHLLKVHQIEFNTEHPHLCSACGNRYSTRSTMLKHVGRAHSELLTAVRAEVQSQMLWDLQQLMAAALTGQQVLVQEQPHSETISTMVLDPFADFSNWSAAYFKPEPSSSLNENNHPLDFEIGKAMAVFTADSAYTEKDGLVNADALSTSSTTSCPSEVLDCSYQVTTGVPAPFEFASSQIQLSAKVEMYTRKRSASCSDLGTEQALCDWCPVCKGSFLLSNMHVKKRVCTKSQFASRCAAELSDHLLFHE